MQKIFMTALVVFGVWAGFTFFYPQAHRVWFMISTFGVTYAMLVMMLVGILAWRSIK